MGLGGTEKKETGGIRTGLRNRVHQAVALGEPSNGTTQTRLKPFRERVGRMREVFLHTRWCDEHAAML